MGAWGHEIFENDDVLDWLAELVEDENLTMIEETLRTALDEEFLEADVASNTLGAAEVLAALQGRMGEEIKAKSEELEEVLLWIKKHQGEGAVLLEIATRATNKVRTNSELLELWQKSGESNEWLQVVDDLLKRLSK